MREKNTHLYNYQMASYMKATGKTGNKTVKVYHSIWIKVYMRVSIKRDMHMEKVYLRFKMGSILLVSFKIINSMEMENMCS